MSKYDREALLEQIQQGEIAHVEGRTALTEADLDFALAAALNTLPEALASESKKPNETTPLVLTPGSAVLSADGLLQPIDDGTQPKPRWNLPGDFDIYLQSGDENSRSATLVREILVGSWRHEGEEDALRERGVFLDAEDNRGNERAVEYLQSLVRQLCQQIGIDPDETQAASQLPAVSWLAERADREAEVSTLQSEISALRTAVSELSARNAELLTASVAPVSEVAPEAEPLGAPSTVAETTSAVLDTPQAPKGKGK